MKNTTEHAEDGVARTPRPKGLLAYALANLVQGGGDAIQLKAHHPPPSMKTLEERLDSVAAAQEQGPILRRIIKNDPQSSNSILEKLADLVRAATLITPSKSEDIKPPSNHLHNRIFHLF